MRRSAVGCFLVIVFSGGAQAAQDMAASHREIAGAMREDMVGRATFDGSLITDVEQSEACITVFTTKAGKVAVDWAHVPDPGVHTIGGKTDVEFQHDDTIGHLVSPLPSSEVMPSITVLYGDCRPQ